MQRSSSAMEAAARAMQDIARVSYATVAHATASTPEKSKGVWSGFKYLFFL